MQELLMPIMMAATVVFLVVGVVQLVGGLSEDRRRLQERLSGEGKADGGFDPALLTVMRRTEEIKGLSGVIAHLPGMTGLSRRIIAVWPNMSLAKFSFLSLGIFVMAFLGIAVVTGSAFLGTCGALFLSFFPLFVLNNRRNRLDRLMMDQLPDALDFLSRILRAGHSLSTGLQMMSDELPQPMSGEFRRCYDQHSLGASLEDALKDTATRVDNPDFGFFVTAILIQRQTGGDLSEVLSNISDMIRQRIRLQQHVKAKTAEGRFTGYVLVGFPVIMFFVMYYLNPKYAQVLVHTTTGLWLLAIAAGLLIIGMAAIRKITTLKV